MCRIPTIHRRSRPISNVHQNSAGNLQTSNWIYSEKHWCHINKMTEIEVFSKLRIMVNNCRHTGLIADSVVVKVWWKVAYNHVAIFAPEVIVIHPKFSVILWRHFQELFYVIRHFLPFLSPTTTTNFKSTCRHVFVYFNNCFVLKTLQVLKNFDF